MGFLSLATAAGALGILVPLQWWNSRRSRLRIQVRAVADTTLHGLVPLAASLPLWSADPGAQWSIGLAAFLGGFLLDLDHVIAFRSLSLENCSTQERRPFGHSVASLLAAGGVTLLLSRSLLLASVVVFAAASHVLFDATDDSGVPLFYPRLRIVRRVPFAAYVLFLGAGVTCAALLV
ncbi:MAG: metal-dependent hydrolase [Planctomycetota bacterium]